MSFEQSIYISLSANPVKSFRGAPLAPLAPAAVDDDEADPEAAAAEAAA
jgi:hypothetical protein